MDGRGGLGRAGWLELWDGVAGESCFGKGHGALLVAH